MKLEKLNDNELVLLGKNGAFEKVCSVIYKRYKNQVNNFLCKYIFIEEDREDIFQETMTKVFLNLKEYEIKKSGFKTWVFKIAKNTAVDCIRNKNTNKQSVIDYSKDAYLEGLFKGQNAFSNPLEEILKKELYDFYEDKINKLPKKYKSAIKSRVDGCSYQEISNKFNLPLNTIKVHIHKGRKLLKNANSNQQPL